MCNNKKVDIEHTPILCGTQIFFLLGNVQHAANMKMEKELCWILNQFFHVIYKYIPFFVEFRLGLPSSECLCFYEETLGIGTGTYNVFLLRHKCPETKFSCSAMLILATKNVLTTSPVTIHHKFMYILFPAD